MEQNDKSLVTVIVCTRNRAKSLRVMLTSLEKIVVPTGWDWEVLVVDNASTDDTGDVVKTFHRQGGLPVRSVIEPRLGLSSARNRGVHESRGAILVYTDDDVIVTETWLQALIREFQTNTDVVVVGGRTLPFTPELPPQGLKLQTERREFQWPFGPGEVIGNNMAFRREVFNRVGLFDPVLSPGRFFGAYDETDFIYRALKKGGTGVYTPKAVIYHNHDRSTPSQVRRFQANYTKGRGAFLMKHVLRGDVFAAKMTYWWVDGIARELAKAVWKQDWPRVSWAVRCLLWSGTGAVAWLGVEAWRLIGRDKSYEVTAHQ